jgi:hypothetical protein
MFGRKKAGVRIRTFRQEYGERKMQHKLYNIGLGRIISDEVVVLLMNANARLHDSMPEGSTGLELYVSYKLPKGYDENKRKIKEN